VDVWRINLSFLPALFRKHGSTILLLFMSGALAACVSPSVQGPGPGPETRPAPRPVSKPNIPPRPAPSNPSAPRPGQPVRSAALSPELDTAVRELWRVFPGKTGIAILSIDGGGTVGQRASDLFPQQSVSKLWVAMAVLDKVDQGTLRLDQAVRVTRSDLAVFHSPLRDRIVANGDTDETISSLMEQAITSSDNTANDSLLRVVGGPEAVRAFIARKNLGSIRFGPGERAMQSAIAGLEWRQEYAIGQRFFTARNAVPYAQRKAALDRYLADPVDGATPAAIVAGLGRLAKGELLSPASTRLLLGLMGRVTSGPNRLKAGVPAGWGFAHKTGTGQQLPPVSTGYNDVGIMTAPDGSRYAVAVMLGDTTASVPERMEFMQSIARLISSYHRR
jgi:beta-lactamase class A